MPKSKKPRHRYRTKVGTNFTAVRRPQLDNLHEIFTDLELKIETLLHRSLEETPVRTVKEWDAARECSKGAIPGQPNQMSVRKLQKLLGSR